MRSTTTRRTVSVVREGVNRHQALVLGLLAAAAVAVVVVLLGPWPITHYQARTSGAWVVNEKQIARLNVDSGTIDLVRDLKDSVVSVQQDGADAWAVVGQPDGKRRIVQVTASGEGSDRPIEVGDGEVVALGGGRLARFDDGALSVQSLAGGEPTRHEVDLGPRTVVEVGPDGTVAAWGPEKGRVALLAPGADEPKVDDAPRATGDAELTLVGDRPVFVDRSTTRVQPGGRDPVEVPGGDPRLQLPGFAADVVEVASPSGLYAVGFDGRLTKRADAPTVAAGATVPRPSVDEHCVYALFPGAASDNAVASCDGREVRTSVPTDARTTAFRSGSPIGVLNSTAADSAAAWFVDGASWRKVPWPQKPEKPLQEPIRQYQPRRKDANQKPQAKDDTDTDALGARPGRITVLPVLHNDFDPDRDALTVVKVNNNGDTRIRLNEDGSVVADLTAPVAGATGSLSFEYTISDGIDQASAKAVVRIRAPNENDAPRRISKEIPLRMGAAVGAPTRFDVVSQYWDPDGDPLYLAKAEISPPRHRLEVDPVGFFTFTAADPTSVAVATTIADVPPSGTPQQRVDDPVQVDVTQGEPQKPILNSDVVTVGQGKSITFDPLANDIDPNGTGLELVKVEAKGDPGPVKAAVANGKLTVSATGEGESEWIYTARSGGQEDFAFLHVRAVAQPGAARLRDDVVVVQQDRTARVDLLRNDDDPSDPSAVFAATALEGPLDLAAADTPPAAALQADMRTVVVDGGSAKAGSYQFRYRAQVSTAGSERQVLEANLVVVVEPGRANRLPTPAVPARTVPVRAGSATTVGLDRLIVNPDDVPLSYELEPATRGEAFLDGSSVRFRASDEPGPVTVTVKAQDALTRTPLSATVTFDVKAAGPNGSPRPAPLEARVRSGQKVVVPVPVAGIDPDGDRVRLQSVASKEQPKRVLKADVDLERQVVAIEARELDADDPGGMESFVYTVEDGVATGEAELKVFVIGRSRSPRPPVAMPDRVVAPVGGTVVVDPLANDSDPEGQPLQLLSAVTPAGGCTAEVVRSGDPDSAPTGVRVGSIKDGCTVGYRVVAGASTPVAGEIRITAVPGYPGKPPVLVDDVAVRPKSGGDTTDVAVLANDSDPDGDIAAARIVRVVGGTVVDGGDGPKVRVAFGDEAALAVYTVRDESGLEASAFVYVPSKKQNRPPVLSGEKVRIGGDRAPVPVDLARLVIDPDGDPLEFAQPVGQDFDVSSYQPGRTTFDLKLRGDSVAAGTYPLRVTVSDGKAAPVTLTVAVDVDPKANTPPTFLGTPACGEVEAGTSGQVVNLRSVVKDPDPGDLDRLEFQVDQPGGEDAGVTVKPTGTGFELAAAQGSPKDVAIQVRVRNVGTSDWSEVRECKVKVKPTTLAPPSLLPVNEVLEEGGSVSVAVSDKVINGGDAKDIKVTSASVVTGTGLGQPSNTDREVSFRANLKAAGDVTIGVTFVDAFKREGNGVINLRVRGRPAPPTAALATAAPAGSAVTVSWTPGSANNAPITAFKVSGKSDKGGTADKTCPGSVTSCTLDKGDGIRNGDAWTFTIVATNEVGDSEPSQPTPTPATPDVAPPAPELKKVDELDERLVATWSQPAFEGTAVTGFEVTGEARDGSPSLNAKPGATDSSVALTPAKNGTEYCVTVVAVNKKGPSDKSNRVCGKPFGDPIVTLTNGRPSGPLQATFDVKIDGNGRDVDRPETAAQGDQGPCDVVLNSSNAVVTCGDNDTKTVDLTIKVRNAGGKSAQASATSKVNNKPSANGLVQLTADKDRAVVASLPPVSGAKKPYWYLSSGRFTQEVDTDRNSGINATAFESTDFTFVVCRQQQFFVGNGFDTDNCSDPVGSNSVVPWGDPSSKSMTVTYKEVDGGGATFALTWSPKAWPAHSYVLKASPPATSSSETIDPAKSPSATLTFSSPAPSQVAWTVCDTKDANLCAQGTSKLDRLPSTTSSSTPR